MAYCGHPLTRHQFDKSLADTMVKQVKTKTTLKVRFLVSIRATALQASCLAAGKPADLPSMRRCLDIHHQEPDVQNGVKRHGQRTAHQNYRVQERRCNRGGQKVTGILPFLPLFDSCSPPHFADISRIHLPLLRAEGGMPCAAVSDRGLLAFFSLRKEPLVQQLCTSTSTIILSILTLLPFMSRESGCVPPEGAFLKRPPFSSIRLARAPWVRANLAGHLELKRPIGYPGFYTYRRLRPVTRIYVCMSYNLPPSHVASKNTPFALLP